jgi:hypothetical protein
VGAVRAQDITLDGLGVATVAVTVSGAAPVRQRKWAKQSATLGSPGLPENGAATILKVTNTV